MKKDDKKQAIGLIIYIAIVIISLLFPGSGDLTVAGGRSLFLFIGLIVLLICKTAPLAFSCLLSLCVMTWMGVFPSFKDAWSGTSVSTMIFMFAALTITVAFGGTSIPKRMAAFAIKASHGNGRLVVLFFMLAVMLVSSIMSNTAAVACFVGICLSIVQEQMKDTNTKQSNLAKCLMIGITIGGGIGGSASPVGSPANMAGIGIMESATGETIGFVNWCIIGYPVAIISTIVIWFIMTTLYKPEPLSDSVMDIEKRVRDEVGALSNTDIKTIIIIVVTFACWIAGTWVDVLDSTAVAVIASVFLMLPGINILSWKDAAKELPWDVIMMSGFIMAVVGAVRSTGAAQWMVDSLLGRIGSMPVVIMIFIMLTIGILIHVPIPSGSALTAFLTLPYVLMLQSSGAVPVQIAPLIVALSAGSGMIMPYDILALITMGSGCYAPQDYIKNGLCCFIFVAIFGAVCIYPLALLAF